MGCVFGRAIAAGSGSGDLEKEREVRRKDEKVGVEVEVGSGVEDSDVEKPGGKRMARSVQHLARNVVKHVEGEQVAAGWPSWLVAVAGEALNGLVPRRADSFQKLDKVNLMFLNISLLSVDLRISCV